MFMRSPALAIREAKWIDGGQVEPGRISLTPPGDGLWMASIRVLA
jgi:hypothetical protein